MRLVSWRRTILLAALALLASLVIACGGDADMDAEKDMEEAELPPFKIGVMESLTGPGARPTAAWPCRPSRWPWRRSTRRAASTAA